MLVSDSRKLWSYDPDLNQVMVRKLGDALEDNFTLIDAGTADGLQFIEAVPTRKEGTFQSVRIGI